MLSRLFSRAAPKVAVLPRAPEGSRVYAVGDVHGRLDLLLEINQLIHEDAYAAQAPRNVAVYLGDYVDRGPASFEVIDHLIHSPLPGFESHHLVGNHEDSMLRFLDDGGIAGPWLDFGGGPTLHSYGVRPPDPRSAHDVARAQEELHRKLPQEHLAFLRSLEVFHGEGDYFFVHAGVKPGVALHAQVPEDMLWIRNAFLDSGADFGKIVVHGHTIVDRPDVRRNRIGIDTGAFASGRLTCLVLQGEEWSFLQT